MRPTAQIHEVARMKFLDVYGRFCGGRLGCEEAAELLGMSVRTFYRWRQRYEEDGEAGLMDARVGKLSAKRVPADTAMQIITLYKTTYSGWTVKHFHEQLPLLGFNVSYTWTKNALQESGLVKKAAKRGQHRRKRPRKPLPGMMIHQDGSNHEWVPGKRWDLIVTMDDATNEIYSMFFCGEEGTMSSFQGLLETFNAKGLPCSFYVDRGSHYFYTPEVGGKVDKNRLTQVGRAMWQLGIEMIPAYSPQARGRSERMFRTLQDRLPQELRLRAITDMGAANKFIRDEYLKAHNSRFAKPAAEEGSAFVPSHGVKLEDILCIQEERTVSNDNTVRYKNKIIQLESDEARRNYARCKVRVHAYPDGNVAVFHGTRKLNIMPCAEVNQNEEGFIAFDPSSMLAKEEGEASTSPTSISGVSPALGSLPSVALSSRTANSLSANV